MKTGALLAVVSALVPQGPSLSRRELLNVTRPLTPTEISTVLNASQEVLAGRTFRLSAAPGNRGIEVLMGPGGQPKRTRMAYSILGGTVSGVPVVRTATRRARPGRAGVKMSSPSSDHTGRPARRCDESVEQGEMVIHYTFHTATRAWSATARQRGPLDDGGLGLAPMFQMLRGAGPVTSGERRRLRDRWVRAFVSPWTPPTSQSSPIPVVITGDPLPNVVGDPDVRELEPYQRLVGSTRYPSPLQARRRARLSLTLSGAGRIVCVSASILHA
jgi:hypothetical protein